MFNIGTGCEIYVWFISTAAQLSFDVITISYSVLILLPRTEQTEHIANERQNI